MSFDEPANIPNVEPRRRYDDEPLLPSQDGRVIIPPEQHVEPWTELDMDALLGIDPETGAIDPDVIELALADLIASGDDELIELFEAERDNV